MTITPSNHPIDDIDRAIIEATQAGLPLTAQPYEDVADQIGIPAEEIMSRMRDMLQNGIIRRIGIVPNHFSLGWKFNGMTVWDVDDTQVDALGARIGALDFVTHCYQRPRFLPEWPYNLFAMIHAKNRDDAQRQIDQIAALLGTHCRAHSTLFSTRILKKTGLRI
jgi:DNA-binding Lrp family transcriptional regulator